MIDFETAKEWYVTMGAWNLMAAPYLFGLAVLGVVYLWIDGYRKSK